MENNHDKKVELLLKYYDKINVSSLCHIGNNIPIWKIEAAASVFAQGVDPSTAIGFIDTSIPRNGKSGFLFTDTKVYWLDPFSKPQKMWYDDIDKIVMFNTQKTKDFEKKLRFYLYDKSNFEWSSPLLNKTPLLAFFNELIEMIDQPSAFENASFSFDSTIDAGAMAGGFAAANYKNVNNLYDEEKFHAFQGHGFAAERANNLYDKLHGRDAKILGDNNVLNGADRYVDGLYIQSKYCQTGADCINACFDDSGKFRYFHDGKPMQIEVPSDKHAAAVEAMKERIKNNQVPGITDPNEAENIVRKGHFTYEQAKNIAKFGTVESLTYDAVNGAITGVSAFGVTAVITFATNLWSGEGFDKSVKIATYSGLKVGGTAFATSIISSQLSKAGLNSALVGSSEAIVAALGPKASAVLINAFRSGPNIYGAAAMKSAAKLLRGNFITATVTVAVLSTLDIAKLFQGRISGKQLFKNLTNTTATVAAGTGGWIGGAAAGTAIFPGVGTAVGIVGGLVGSVVAGAVAGKATNAILDKFIEDDAEEMVRIIQDVFKDLAIDYLLNQKEAEKSIDLLQEDLDGKKLQDMFASKDRKQFAKELLTPYIERIVRNRRHIRALTTDEMVVCLKTVLEEISDAAESEDIAQ